MPVICSDCAARYPLTPSGGVCICGGQLHMQGPRILPGFARESYSDWQPYRVSNHQDRISWDYDRRSPQGSGRTDPRDDRYRRNNQPLYRSGRTDPRDHPYRRNDWSPSAFGRIGSREDRYRHELEDARYREDQARSQLDQLRAENEALRERERIHGLNSGNTVVSAGYAGTNRSASPAGAPGRKRHSDGTYINLSINNRPNESLAFGAGKRKREEDKKNEYEPRVKKPALSVSSRTGDKSGTKEYCLVCHVIGHRTSMECKSEPDRSFLPPNVAGGWKKYLEGDGLTSPRHETLIQAQDAHYIALRFLSEGMELFLRERDALLSLVAMRLQKVIEPEAFAAWKTHVATCASAVQKLILQFRNCWIGYHYHQVIVPINELRPDGPIIPMKMSAEQALEGWRYLNSIRNDKEKIQIKKSQLDRAVGWLKGHLTTYLKEIDEACQQFQEMMEIFPEARKNKMAKAAFHLPMETIVSLPDLRTVEDLRIGVLYLPVFAELEAQWLAAVGTPMRS